MSSLKNFYLLKRLFLESLCQFEEFINWHPVGGISWEERAKRMEAAGVTESNKSSKIKIPNVQLTTASN